jgi:hypothetical protein
MWALWQQSGIGAGFLQVLWFALPITPPISPLLAGAGTMGSWVQIPIEALMHMYVPSFFMLSCV